MSPMTLLALLGALQGAVLGLALLTIRRGSRKANGVLGVFVILFSAALCTQPLLDMNVYQRVPHLMLVANPLMLAFGPLLFLYVVLLTSRSGSIPRLTWLNFIPFLAHVISLMPFYLQSAEDKLALLGSQDPVSSGDYALTTFQLFHMCVYLLIIFFLVRRHRRRLQHTFSSTEEICLDWLSGGIRWLFALSGLLVLTTGLHFVGLQGISDTSGNLVLISIVVIIYGIGYRGLRQPEILGLADVEEAGRKYEKSTLTDSAADSHIVRLREAMDNEKPYLSGDLTIRDLAEVSKIPS